MLTADDLNAMTIAGIRAAAEENGYNLSGSKKSELVDSYLAQQGGGDV